MFVQILHQKNCIHHHKNCLFHIMKSRRYSDILPKQTRKIFAPNPNKKPIERIKTSVKAPTFEEQNTLRTNALDIQMLSKPIYEQIFPKHRLENINPVVLEQCKKALIQHKMITKVEDYTSDTNFRLPPLEGRNIEDHFRKIAEDQLNPYKTEIDALLKQIPAQPDTWELKPGWIRYVPGREPAPVDYPLEKAIVFDIEVCMAAGKAPTLATAVSSEAWYGWVSPSLIEGASKPVTEHHYSLESLIPLESTENDDGLSLNETMKAPKVVIGHNVCYDRARIKEQYWLNRTGTRFVDTMSLHVCVSGLTSFQRATLKSAKLSEEIDESWREFSSLNGLDQVYKLYCNKTMSKTTRDLFVTGTLPEIKAEFQEVMKYCANDVNATYQVLQKLFPLFMERFPHPVTLAGMFELSTAYLPINANWNRYITNAKNTYEDLENESRILLTRRADHACQLLHNEMYKKDIWLWDLDWETKSLKSRSTLQRIEAGKIDDEELDEAHKKLAAKFSDLVKTKQFLSSVNTHLPGYPAWYRKLCRKPDDKDWIPGPNLISTSMQITPKLLSLTWEGYPLHYMREFGWGFLIPFTSDVDVARKLPLEQLLEKCPILTAHPVNAHNDALNNINKLVQDDLGRREYYSRVKKDKTDGLYKGAGVWCNAEIDDCCYFFKLPHKNGPAYNVGNPLAKDFLNKFSENVLVGDSETAEAVLTIARKLSYWRNNRARIFDQMLVWLPCHQPGYKYGAIVPQVVVAGTLTRRAVEPTWMTASNAHPERIGSELRAMVQAPPGYNFVGADVDSQELWIASVIGDAYCAKTHGATPFGWMTLSGAKATGTDMHSVTAKAVGISRDHAKVINYARIYGAGQNFAERLLKQFNPTLSDGEARAKANKMFALTKGRRVYSLKKEYHCEDFPDVSYNKWHAFEIAKSHGKRLEEMFCRPKWIGGTESAMFNRLESIANDAEPRTPFLKGRLSRALEPKSLNDDRYLPTRVNWVVQSGAVDFLHLMLVCMRWLTGENARFCLSFHDEVRYIVPEEYKYEVVLAMHLTNLLTRSFCAMKLGIYDLPQSVAFFSSVEVDTVLRKESKHDCRTPSNPHGLENGYNVPNGESLNIYEAIEKAQGARTSWYLRLKK